MNLIPLHDNVIIKKKEVSNTTESGLYIPESSKEKPTQGEVIAVGPGKVLSTGVFKETTLKVGDKVIFPKYAGTEIVEDKVKYQIMPEEQILAKES